MAIALKVELENDFVFLVVIIQMFLLWNDYDQSVVIIEHVSGSNASPQNVDLKIVRDIM